MIITVIIMNMQNKLYTIQFFSPFNDRSAAAITECQTCEFLRITGKKPYLLDKRGFKLMEKRRAESLLPPS